MIIPHGFSGLSFSWQFPDLKRESTYKNAIIQVGPKTPRKKKRLFHLRIRGGRSPWKSGFFIFQGPSLSGSAPHQPVLGAVVHPLHEPAPDPKKKSHHVYKPRKKKHRPATKIPWNTGCFFWGDPYFVIKKFITISYNNWIVMTRSPTNPLGRTVWAPFSWETLGSITP